jgi:DNA-binding response OmpR family regulator
MKLLLIEDSERLSDSIARGLRRSGWAVDLAHDGEVGLARASGGEYDVIVLDLMLPKLDGLTLLRRLRESGSMTHVLVLTAKDAVEDRVLGLRIGADDYLIKPFDFEELLARVDALGRRRHEAKDPFIRLGEVVIDTASKTVSCNGTPVELARREYMVLEYLALRRGQSVSREDLEQHVYDSRKEIASNAIDSAVCAIRRRLERAGQADLIRTRRGFGYTIRAGAQPSTPR